jgi:DNA replication protein DnaC
MQINILKKPNQKIEKMKVDEIIDEKLKLYPMVEDTLSKTNFTAIIGGMGSGKTTLITNFLKGFYKQVFNHIFIIIPEMSRRSLSNDIYDKNLPDDQLFDSLTVDNLKIIYSRLEEATLNNEYSILIIDDFQVELKDKEISKILQRIITKMRHLRCSVFLLCQNFIKMDKSIRNLATNIILFNINKSQQEDIFSQVLQLEKYKYEMLNKLYIEKGDWLLFNLTGRMKIYKNYDEVVFT